MSGEPFNQAKLAVIEMAKLMSSKDGMAVVTYDDNVNTVIPFVTDVNTRQVAQTLARIDTGGCTDLHAGWLAGTSELADDVSTRAISRVLLLSDGNANSGITEMNQIVEHVAALSEAGVTTCLLYTSPSPRD